MKTVRFEDVANNLPAGGLCLVTNGTGVCTKPEGHDYGHFFRTMRPEVTVSQPPSTGTTVRPPSCIGSGRLYAMTTTVKFQPDAKANPVWYAEAAAITGRKGIAYGSCPDCGALVQIINDRIPEHYGR